MYRYWIRFSTGSLRYVCRECFTFLAMMPAAHCHLNAVLSDPFLWYPSITSTRIDRHSCSWDPGLSSLSGRISYCNDSWNPIVSQWLWNLTGPRCLSNVRAIWPLQHPISRPRDFKRFGRKTSYRLVNRSPGVTHALLINVFTIVENGVWYSWTSWVEHVTGLVL